MKINQPLKFVTVNKAIGNKIGSLTVTAPLFTRVSVCGDTADKMKTTKRCVLLVTPDPYW